MTSNGLKTIRKRLHSMKESLDETVGSRELSLAKTNLENARMWLGECLAEEGMSTPYSDSLDPTNEKIADQADVPADDDKDVYMPADGSHIKHIKELRACIVRENDKVRQTIVTGSKKQFYRIALTQAYVHMGNARMWLGKELNRIHDESTSASAGS